MPALARALAAIGALLAALLVSARASAHGTRSSSIDVTEVAPGKAIVHVRSSSPRGPFPRVVFEAPCTPRPADEAAGKDTIEGALSVECPGTLAGATVRVDGLGPVLAEAILVVSLADGRHLSRVLTADEPSYVLPPVQSGASIAAGYVRLGFEHILTGYDHLLFLTALVLLLRRPRAVLLAETAFTISHSLSFSATALGLVRVSAPAAEAAIALSLVLVALDIGKDGDASNAGGGVGANAKKGAAMAFVFGLVHGLGFAGGLREIGLPEQHVPLALAGFAAGVEVGQVAFLAVVLLLVHLAVRRVPRARFEPALAAVIGAVASYWLVERTLVLFSNAA
jgi:hydrogenase/urease accessory protein HupE